MKKSIKTVYILVSILIWQLGFSQQTLITELQTKITNSSKNTQVHYLHKALLAEAIKFKEHSRSLALVNEALHQQNVSLKDSVKIQILKIAVDIYRINDQYTDMNNAIENLLTIALKTKKPEDLANAYYFKAKGLDVLNNPNILPYYFKSLQYAEKTNNNLLLSNIYYKIYGYYASKHDLLLENKYANHCLSAAIKSNDPQQITLAWQAKGTSFYDLNKNKNPKIDSTLIAFRKGISVFKQNKNKIILQSQLAILQLNTAVHLYQLYMPAAKDSVDLYATLALKNGLATKHEGIIINCLGLLSQLADMDNNNSKIEALLLQSKAKIESYSVKQPDLQSKIYYALSQFYKKKNDQALALTYYELYVESYTLSSEENLQRSNQLLDAKYELTKKQDQIKLLDDKNKAITYQKYLYVGIAILLFIALILLFVSYNYKLKYSIQQQKVLEIKTEETNLKAALLETEQRLILAEKKQLQKELLAESVQVERKKELLHNMKAEFGTDKLDQKTIQNLTRIINEEIRLDKDFATLKTDIKEIDPEFISRLQQQSDNKLTQLDLKYCSYLKLNLTTKQMSKLLHVEPSSIRMNKYRLKQKLQLSKDQDLNTYLDQL